jgi:hypothetical protein
LQGYPVLHVQFEQLREYSWLHHHHAGNLHVEGLHVFEL